MLFTWSTENLCIVFSSWRITSTVSLIFSLLAVMALTAGYEAVREVARKYERTHAMKLENATRKSNVGMLGCKAGEKAHVPAQASRTMNAAHSSASLQAVRRKRRSREERWSRRLCMGYRCSIRSSLCVFGRFNDTVR